MSGRRGPREGLERGSGGGSGFSVVVSLLSVTVMMVVVMLLVELVEVRIGEVKDSRS